MGNNMKAERARLGLTQKELAEIIGTDPSNVSRWEKNLGKCSASTLIKIAQALDTSIDYLTGRTENRRGGI